MARFTYLELPVRHLDAEKAFYAAAFGWTFADFGPDYSTTMTGQGDLGLNGDQHRLTTHLLPVLEVANLEATEAAIRKAGGEITLAIFSYPGGRRFHFRDVAGHELGVMQLDPPTG